MNAESISLNTAISSTNSGQQSSSTLSVSGDVSSQDVSEQALFNTEDVISIGAQDFELEETSRINITLSERDTQRLDRLERALEALQEIPEQIAEFEAEFNQRYLESLQERLRIYQSLGSAADSRSFLSISREALSIARQSLEQTNLFLGPELDQPQLLETLVQSSREGSDVTITLNNLVPTSREG